MSWVLLAALAPLSFVIYQALAKLLPQGTSIFLVNAYASLVGFLFMLLASLFTSGSKSTPLTPKNLLLVILIGIFISLGNFLIIKGYSLGASQSSFSAIMYPLLIIYSTLVGVFVWHEKINTMQFVGILLSVVGIIFVFYFKDSPQLIK